MLEDNLKQLIREIYLDCLCILPQTTPTAKVIANGGYSKRDVAEYLWEHTRITVHEANMLLQQFTGVGLTVHDAVEQGRLPKWFDAGPDDTIPILANADMNDIVVCGDASRDKIMSLWCNYNRPVTKEVKPPADWEKRLQQARK